MYPYDRYAKLASFQTHQSFYPQYTYMLQASNYYFENWSKKAVFQKKVGVSFSTFQKSGVRDKKLITKTCLYKFYPLKPHFYIVKLGFIGVYIIFLIST